MISLRFNGHSRCLLKQRVMEMVATTGAISRAKLQSATTNDRWKLVNL